MFIPHIYFRYAYPFDTERRRLYEVKNIGYYPDIKEVRDRTEVLQTLWDDLNQNDKVIQLIIDITGVTLQRDLEMYIFGSGMNPMSSPLMMPVVNKAGWLSDDECIETIIHEIIHRFIGDENNNSGIENYWGHIRTKYVDESKNTRTHILLFAILESVLIQLFDRERAEKLTYSGIDEEYQRALNIARGDKEGLIKEFRSFLV